MAFIDTIPPEDASGTLRDLYDQDLKAVGHVRNLTRDMSLRPEVIVALRDLLGAIRSNIDPRRYELVTVAAASALRCSA